MRALFIGHQFADASTFSRVNFLKKIHIFDVNLVVLCEKTAVKNESLIVVKIYKTIHN